MRLKRFVLKFSGKNYISFLIFCLVAVCFCQTIDAQSGRRANKGTAAKPLPSDVDVPKIDLPVSSKPDEKILSLIVLGREKNNSPFSYSSDLNTVLKECVKTLEEHALKSGSGLTAIKADKKWKLEDAIERAKKETTAHILWIELGTGIDGLGNEWLNYIDYAVITPKTGTRVTSGRVQPGRLDPSIGQGGILQLPTDRRARRRISPSTLRDKAQEIVFQLIRQEWI